MQQFFLTIIICLILSIGSVFAGVISEGVATGIAPAQTLSYDKGTNTFTINGSDKIVNPVSAQELLETIAALRLDDRFGVSVKLNNELIVYGKLGEKDIVAKKMEDTDNFFRGVVFAEMSMLKGYTLPGGYRPKAAHKRTRASVILFTLDGFEYGKNGNTYTPARVDTKVILIPMAKYTAPDGGYLPDYDALEKGHYQEEDKENTDHINQNKQEYLALEIVENSIKVGQVAALVRFFRQSGINLDALYNSVKIGDGKVLQGNPVSVGTATVEPKVMVEDEKKTADTGAQKEDYSAKISAVLKEENAASQQGKAQLSPSSVNDGSYVKYREAYLKALGGIDLSGLPADFVAAFKDYETVWEKTVEWMQGQKIERSKESVEDFQRAHAPFRKELRDTFDKCKNIAGKYGVKVD